ncbi:hypothetical protein GF323_06910 [Candidatus Woesearchaeota archaeon]|nr:hypothetical protein [Candidatus Woesearchaeota archaeon]
MVPIKQIAMQLWMKERKIKKNRIKVKNRKIKLDEELVKENIAVELEPEEGHLGEIKQSMGGFDTEQGKTEREGESDIKETYINEDNYKKENISYAQDTGDAPAYKLDIQKEMKARIHDWFLMIPKRGNPEREEYLKLLS